ncbi:mitochondrial fission regulator 2 isoform X1 [Callorhinchus milii]|uniref:mitochondrial fission regulator 2 isoform X1 n=1 Tax=Callorhinchus milii TaxID=7868 RepID=UPI0004571590|nr:mitochondrial fission regulator 2 isoform X1 [Callorhinchus milii]|eukprot:gi/632951278/ref/XP_007891201.1/ PREDICTED: mitochondrial fission regulator 2 isoform X2 [Callorhinchus milii]
MSRLLNFIYELMEYFGIPFEQFIPHWQNKPHGQTRSIVRRIGSFLPINNWARVCFQLIGKPSMSNSCESGYNSVVPSLADILWIANDEGETFTWFRNMVRPFKGERMAGSVQVYDNQKTSVNQFKYQRSTENPDASNQNALKKISQLEDELSRLRAQIATIITMQEQGSVTGCLTPMRSNGLHVPNTPRIFLPPPKLTSTPIGESSARSMTAPPPPPPPPPPKPSTSVNSTTSLVDLVRERRASKPGKTRLIEKTPGLPNIMDVLKDIHNVKLRVVERSPGGTVAGKKPAKKASVSDPAALIADALKRKFAHKFINDSSDKENTSFETSPLSSPETSRFGLQHLKSAGKPNVLGPSKILQSASVNVAMCS